MSTSSQQIEQAEQMLEHLESVQAQLSQMQQALARSHRLSTLGTIAAIIAHEFNNILTPVISYCQLAQRKPDDAAMTTKALTKAHDGALKAAHICESLLGFSRETSTARSAQISEVINQTFACLARDPSKDGIELTIDVPCDAWVAIDPTSLQQVLLNMVLNARKAIGRSGGKLSITARRDGPSTVLTVADTGPGIPPQLLDNIFKPFVTHTQPDAEGEQSKGTGLGLAICKDLAERAGGGISVQSTPGRGATFIIQLPTAEPGDE